MPSRVILTHPPVRPVGRRGRGCAVGWMLALVAVVVAGCTTPTPDTAPGTGSSGPATGSGSATPTTVSTGPDTSPAAGTTTAAGTGTVSSSVAVTLPPGTVVPFRTAGPGSASGLRIGVIAPVGSDPFSTAVSGSVVAQAQAAGAEVIRCDPGANPTLELDCAQRLATQRVDGWIVVQPVDVGEALCAAGPRGVPLIGIATTALSCQTARVGADDDRAGFQAGSALGRYVRARLNCTHDAVMLITDGAAGVVSDQRAAGIRRGLAAQCPVPPPRGEVTVDADQPDGGVAAVTAALATVPDDADLVVGAVDDGGALAAAAAIPASRPGRVVIAGIGADQRARCAAATDARWIGDTDLFGDRYGEVAVPALLDAVQGRPVPPNMYIDTQFVDSWTVSRGADPNACPDR